jgi:hypothetical protein
MKAKQAYEKPKISVIRMNASKKILQLCKKHSC